MKKIFSVLKFVFGIILSMTIMAVIANYWPMPDLISPPTRNDILIESIHIVDIESGQIISNQNVFIENNRIKSIENYQADTTYEGLLTVDGRGKFLMPGLWDMHTHSSSYSPWLHHPLYIANGVTGVRDMSGRLNKKDSYWVGTEERRKWNRQMIAGSRISPRYVLQSSYQINGSKSVPNNFPGFFRAGNEAEVLELLDYYQNEDADFIKVYAEIKANSYRTLLKESSNYGLHVAGHKPFNVSLKEAILLGQRSFEHGRIFMFDCFSGSQELLEAENKVAAYKKLKPLMVKTFDMNEAEELMQLMSENSSYWTPTLQTLKVDTFSNLDHLKSNPLLKYIPKMRQSLWWNPFLGRDGKNASDELHKLNEDFYNMVTTQVKMASKHKVPIMAGTDVTDTNIIPGFSLHNELAELVKAGLTTQEALMAATITPARYSNLDSDFGSIEEGKIADLLILAKNPLEDISNTRTITGVTFGGAYYDEQKLEELKSLTESTASSIHMNLKFLTSLLSSPLMRIQLAD
ncbi:MAG: amidohydrolase family protein [Balneolaceae bacterium]